MDQLSSAEVVPNRRVVLYRIVPDRDDDVGRGKQLISGRIIELADAARETAKKVGGHGTRGLKGSDGRNTSLSHERSNWVSILGFAGEQPQQQHCAARIVDHSG